MLYEIRIGQILHTQVPACMQHYQLLVKASTATSIRSSNFFVLLSLIVFFFTSAKYFGFIKCFINNFKLSFNVSNFVSGAILENTSLKERTRTKYQRNHTL